MMRQSTIINIISSVFFSGVDISSAKIDTIKYLIARQ